MVFINRSNKTLCLIRVPEHVGVESNDRVTCRAYTQDQAHQQTGFQIDIDGSAGMQSTAIESADMDMALVEKERVNRFSVVLLYEALSRVKF